jgi:hypothetical protein
MITFLASGPVRSEPFLLSGRHRSADGVSREPMFVSCRYLIDAQGSGA